MNWCSLVDEIRGFVELGLGAPGIGDFDGGCGGSGDFDGGGGRSGGSGGDSGGRRSGMLGGGVQWWRAGPPMSVEATPLTSMAQEPVAHGRRMIFCTESMRRSLGKVARGWRWGSASSHRRRATRRGGVEGSERHHHQSIIHMVARCSCSQEVWILEQGCTSNRAATPQSNNHRGNLKTRWTTLMGKNTVNMSVARMLIITNTTWNIWKDRCRQVYDNKAIPPAQLVQIVLQDIEALRMAHDEIE